LAFYRREYKDIGIFSFFIFMGLAVLTKAVLGVCFTLIPVVAFLTYTKAWRILKTPAMFWGFIAFCLIVIPWHGVMYKWYGQTFIDEYWHNVHVRRLFEAEHPKNDTWYFYLGLMFAGVMPWSLFIFPMIRMVYTAMVYLKKERQAFVFLLFWIVGVYIFVQPPHSKLASYIFPVFPAIAILIGVYLHKAMEGQAILSQRIIGYLWTVLLLVGSMVAIFVVPQYHTVVPDLKPVYVFSFLAVVCALFILFCTVTDRRMTVLVGYFSITVLVLVTLFLGRPYAEPWVSCKEITDQFKQINYDDSVVLTSKFYARGVRFYTDRNIAVVDINGKGFFSTHPIPFLNTPEKLLEFLVERPRTYAILKQGDINRLKDLVGHRYKVEQIGNGIGGKYIIKIEKI